MNEPGILPQFHYGDPAVTQLSLRDLATSASMMSIKKEYFNHLSLPVTVKERSGLTFSLASNPVMGRNEFVIRMTLVIHSAMRDQVHRFLCSVNDESNGTLKATRDAFNMRVIENKNGPVTIVLDYTINLNEMQNYGGTVYFSEIDTLLSISSVGDAPNHPYSSSEASALLENNLNTEDYSFVHAINIVDNLGLFGNKYVQFGGSIYPVPSKKNPEMRDGIYIVGNKAMMTNSAEGNVEVQRYDFHDAERLNLYNSFEEARAAGLTETTKKHELTYMEHALQKSKAEQQAFKQQHEKEMQEKEAIIKRMQIENDRVVEELRVGKLKLDQSRELELMSAKSVSEHRSYDRKDSSELMKFIPAVIMGLGATFLAIKSFFK
jgi:hypothetical protein